MPDDRLIVALDLPHAAAGLALAVRLGDAVSFYKVGLGMLTGGGLALARELKEEHGNASSSTSSSSTSAPPWRPR
jgi:orotidine-5'-phosphate decarboxylase